MSFTSYSEQQTKKFAADLIKKFQPKLARRCLVLALEGELGSGKTIFAKGVAWALRIKKVIRSPSFIIEREFPYRSGKISGKFVHVDLWRIENDKELEKLNLVRHFQLGNIILIEWAEKIGKFLGSWEKKAIILSIKIKFLSEEKRKIEVN